MTPLFHRGAAFFFREQPMTLDPIAIQNLWASCCRHVHEHAVTMGSLCGPEAAELILNVAGKFSGQRAPETHEQIFFRVRQQTVIGTLIGSIAHADTMAKICPGNEATILEAAREVSVMQLPQSDADLADIPVRQMALAATVAAICADQRT